jgi:sterol desaturase/sphingolipid hydroxylase (fatty acid hydroxylase superfamily)
MPIVRSIITTVAFPVNFLCAQLLALWLLSKGWEQGAIVSLIVVATAFIVLILERLHPYHKSWNRSQQDLGIDAIHALVSQILLPKYGEVALQMLLLGVAIWLSGYYGSTLWPDHWHLGFQLALALVVGQFFKYWAHRCMYEIPLFSMAELHRWHHSRVLEEANSNYGNNIILWDLIFGTFYHPKDREPSEDVGLSDIPDFPKDYLGQLLSPVRWKQIHNTQDRESG